MGLSLLLRAQVDLSSFYKSDHWWLTRIGQIVGKSISVTHKPQSAAPRACEKKWSFLYHELEHALSPSESELSFEPTVRATPDPFLRICHPSSPPPQDNISTTYLVEATTKFLSDGRKLHPSAIEVLLQAVTNPSGLSLALVLSTSVYQNNIEVIELIVASDGFSFPQELFNAVHLFMNRELDVSEKK